MFFKPKIVRFNNGKYGVRRGFWPIYWYLDNAVVGLFKDEWWPWPWAETSYTTFSTETRAREARGAWLQRNFLQKIGFGTVVKERSE